MKKAKSRAYGQVLFIQAVERLSPDVLRSLRDGPYETWIKRTLDRDVKPAGIQVDVNPMRQVGFCSSKKALGVIVLGDARERAQRHLAARNSLTVAALETLGLAYLRQSMEAWSKQWNLTDSWCIEWALNTLTWWRYRIDDAAHSCPPWYWWEEENPLRHLPPFVDSYSGFEIRPLCFDPRLQTPDQYRRDVNSLFEAEATRYRDQLQTHLKDYLLNAEREMLAKDVPPPRELRAEEHFDWLAGYQVKGWSEERISQAENKDRTTVGKQIAELAILIGLSRREAVRYDREQTVETIRRTLRSVQRQERTRNSSPKAPRELVS